mmetsp:Transcript_35916/g.55150  ORF Transcript_35916/g.55150 Transcript_35916/m.55150 type:complete len:310 (-) Transcript_35916:249-1178(-)
MKGEDINFIGQLNAMGVSKKNHLRTRDYDDGGSNVEKAPNAFMRKQEEERIKKEKMRPDKHLLPIEKFIDPVTKKKVVDDFGKLPFHTIDLIFNHKNIWANLANPNPQLIMYNIHDNTKWLPLIADPDEPHPKIVERERINAGLPLEEPKDDMEKENTKKKKNKKGGKGEDKKDARLFEMKLQGDYMKPFTSFYDPKAMTPPITEKMVAKIESKIYKETEIAIKQVRSSRNLNCNIKSNHMTRTIMGKYIDFLEDMECQRILKPNLAKTNVNKELMKLVPENFKISMLPAFFNHTDGERIGTVIRDTSH